MRIRNFYGFFHAQGTPSKVLWPPECVEYDIKAILIKILRYKNNVTVLPDCCIVGVMNSIKAANDTQPLSPADRKEYIWFKFSIYDIMITIFIQ